MRPHDTEYAAFYAAYIARVPEDDLLNLLEVQPAELRTMADNIDPEEELYRYAPEKWSVRQVFGHLVDTERVMGYRAFRIGRGDATPLPGFDERAYVAASDFEDRTVKEMAHEFAAVRTANLWTIRRWTPDAWPRMGTANGHPISARSIAYILAGHVRHHVAILRERYRISW
jgi:DinB superfamily